MNFRETRTVHGTKGIQKLREWLDLITAAWQSPPRTQNPYTALHCAELLRYKQPINTFNTRNEVTVVFLQKERTHLRLFKAKISFLMALDRVLSKAKGLKVRSLYFRGIA